MRLIDVDAFKAEHNMTCKDCQEMCNLMRFFEYETAICDICKALDDAPTVYQVAIEPLVKGDK